MIWKGVLLTLAAAGVLAADPALAQQRDGLTQGEVEALELAPVTVAEVRQALAEAGYASEDPAGSWGDSTSQALRAFQEAEGMEPSGRLDRETFAALGLQNGG